jgi:ABC-2 type transport system permease protein
MTQLRDVHTDPAALAELTAVVTHEETRHVDSGAVAGYRAARTLRVGVEVRRQLHRRRTHLVLGLVSVLPLVLVTAFGIGTTEENQISSSFTDLAVTSAPNFVVFALFVASSLLLPLVVALFFGETIASEASWSSLKYLLAIPVPRLRLLKQKAIAAGLLSAFTLALLPAMALLVGVIWYGAGDATSPSGDAIPFGRSVLALLIVVAYVVVQLSWLGGLALLLSVFTDAPLGAVGGALLASILSQILDQITALGSLRDFLPTHRAWAWTDLLASDVDWTNLATGVLTSVVYATVFAALAARRFARKDITS